MTSTLSISATDADKAEGYSGQTPFTFTVTRTGDLTGASSAKWTVAGTGDSAARGSDFPGDVFPTGTVSFAAGEATQLITIYVDGDKAVEADDSFKVTLSAASTGTKIGVASATGIIRNDDGIPPVFAVAATDADHAEGTGANGMFTFTINRSGGIGASDAIDWHITGGTADAADFGGTLPTGSVIFAPGETSKTVSIAVAGDALVESDESFSFDVYDHVTGSQIGTAAGTIRNDDVALPPALAITALDADKAEGNTGDLTPFTFTVTRTGDLSGVSTAKWAVSGDSSKTSAATATDFPNDKFPTGTVSFAAGESSKTITVNVEGDKGVEPDNGFKVTLSSVSAGTSIKTATALGVIRNDDFATHLAITATDADKAEGNSGSTPFTFTVTRSGDVSVASSAHWDLTGSGANPATATDFTGGTLPGGTVSFAAGETSKTITVGVAGDTLVEADKGFTLTLSSPTGGDITAASAGGTIRNDDVATPPPMPPALAITALDADKAEGNVGDLTPFTFTVTRTGDLSGASSAKWTVSGDSSQASAAAANDFPSDKFPTGIVSFAAGESSKIVTVLVDGDKGIEPDNGFKVTLSAASAGTSIKTATALGVIRNDDFTPSYAITPLNADHAEGNSGTSAFTFTVSRGGDISQASSVDWKASGNAGHFAGDILPGGTVSFAAGETSKVITVNAIADTLAMGDKSFSIDLFATGSSQQIGGAHADGVIRNDDYTFGVSATPVTLAEGNFGSTYFTFTITQPGASDHAVTANWAVTGSGPNPASASDFVGGLPSGTVVFAVGETSKTIHIPVVGDTIAEMNETFTVALTSSSEPNAFLIGSAIGTILDDDSRLTITPLDADKAEGNSGTTPFTFLVSRTGDTSNTLTGHWILTGGSGDDFTNAGVNIINFAAGEASKVITVGVRGDTLFEGDETFTVSVGVDTSGLSYNVDSSTTGVIRNDDISPPAGTFSIVATDADKAEGNAGVTPFTFTISRAGDLTLATNVGWSVSGMDQYDFQGSVRPTGNVTFAPGETSKLITVNVVGDKNIETDEGFDVFITPASGTISGSSSAHGVVRNDDFSPPNLAIVATDAYKYEGDSNSTPFTFTVSRYNDLSIASTVKWAVSSGGNDAASASDFVGGVKPSGSLTFAPGENSKTITINVAGDTTYESNEIFLVTLSSPSSGTVIGQNVAYATIRNDDLPAPSLVIKQIQDGIEGGVSVFQVTRSGSLASTSTVQWAVSSSGEHPATADDFIGNLLPSGSISFAAGESTKNIVIQSHPDSTFEPSETFTVTLSSPSTGTTINTASAIGAIDNDDLLYGLSIEPLSAVHQEGDSGSTPFTFLVTRTGDMSVDVSVRWVAEANSATADDFVGGVLPSGIVNLAPGQANATITVNVAGDTTYDDSEAFTVRISPLSPEGAYFAIGSHDTAWGAIINDDPGISKISADSFSDSTEGREMWFLVQRSEQTSFPETIYWSVSGTGPHPVDAKDFVGGQLPSGSISFDSGGSFGTLSLTTFDDDSLEADEQFVITFSRTPGGPAIATTTGTVTNNDFEIDGIIRHNISGGFGADHLYAGTAPNHVTTMAGGDGQDIFDFSAPGAARIVSTGGTTYYQTINDMRSGIDHIDLAFTLKPDDLLVSAKTFATADAAKFQAQTLLNNHAGTTDVAMVKVGTDMFLFYNEAGTGGAINATIKLYNIDGNPDYTLTVDDFI